MKESDTFFGCFFLKHRFCPRRMPTDRSQFRGPDRATPSAIPEMMGVMARRCNGHDHGTNDIYIYGIYIYMRYSGYSFGIMDTI